MAKEIKFKVRLSVDGKEQLVSATSSVKELTKAMGGAGASSRRMLDSLMLFNNAAQALQSLQSVIGSFTSAYAEQETAERKLETVMRQRMDATDAEIASIKKLASAQQELGVIGDEVQLAGAQQVATFLKEKSSLDVLLPAMNNLLAQQKGLNATGGDAVTVGNLMGKAMQGQTSALRRVGITFDAAQEQVMKYGSESERAAMLAKIITANVGEMNVQLRQTPSGQVKAVSNAMGDLREQIGRVLAPYEGAIRKAAELGMAATSVITLTKAFKDLHIAQTLASLSSAALSKGAALFGPIATRTAASVRVLSAALTSGAYSAVAMKVALRGLLASTLVGAAVVALGYVLEKLIVAFTETGDAAERAGRGISLVQATANRASQAFDQKNSEVYGNLMTRYAELQAQWKSLSSDHAKNAWVKENQHAFGELGVRVLNAADAESVFKKNTDAVVQSFVARARAAAYLAQLTEEYRIQMELLDKITSANDAAQARHRVAPGQEVPGGFHTTDGGYEELTRDGKWVYTEKGAARENAVRYYANDSATKQARAAYRKSLERSKNIEGEIGKIGKQGTYVPPTGGDSKGKGVKTGKTAKEEKRALTGEEEILKARIDALAELRARAANAAEAAAIEADRQAVEKELEAYYVEIGVKQPDAEEVKTWMDGLRGQLDAAQHEFDDAVTVDARVAAQAKVDALQREIDEATHGRLTIAAPVESTYIVAGSDADKRGSWQNAQSMGSRIQSDYEIGLIGKDEALRQLAELNVELEKLGLKPIEIDLQTEDVEKARATFDLATDAVDQLGGSLSQLGGALDVPALDVAGTMAQAIATMVQGYAEASKLAAETNGPWAWIAFAATGLAQLSAMVSSVKGMGAFAEGGIVSGPTLALVGEYAGARNNPEVIAPLDKLKGLVGSAGVGGRVEFGVRGRRLVGVLANETRMSGKSGRRSRIRI